MNTLVDLISGMEVKEEDEEFQNAVDHMFKGLERRKPHCFAVKQYKKYRLASGKTAKSILLSAAVRLTAFTLPEFSRITSRDTLLLDELGDRKRAIFCVIPDNDSTFNFLVGMLYTQVFQTLYRREDQEYCGRLPVPVRIIMDEFANVALPDDFEKILATCRSREISLNIVIQNMAQLKALFEKSWENITGNCDSFLYLGGNEQNTHEYVSKMLGKATIDTRTRGITKGRNGSSSENFQNAGRELLTPDEVRMIDNSKALLFIRGERPVMDDKFDILGHPNIKKTADGGAKPYRPPAFRWDQDDLTYTVDDLSAVEVA